MERPLSLWKESNAAVGMQVRVVQIQCSPDIKSSTWHKLLFNLYHVFLALSTCFALHRQGPNKLDCYVILYLLLGAYLVCIIKFSFKYNTKDIQFSVIIKYMHIIYM